MSRQQRAILINGMLAAFSFIGGVTANIATGTLPESVKDYSWVFWLLTAVFALITVWLTVAGAQDVSDAEREAKDRTILLRRVKREVQLALDDRLPGRNPQIDLEFSLRSLPLPRPDLRLERGRRRLPDGVVVPAEIFAREGGLLILGAPGAGKTTELWLLAEQLHSRAAAESAQPIPLFLNLSSWGSWKGSFRDWLVGQLGDRYKIGRDLARRYLEDASVILLLDGLDEVEATRREECVTAINSFIAEGEQTIAVCSRLEEYDLLTGRLNLPAVIVDPLSVEQIKAYLRSGGAQLRGLVEAFRRLPLLRELARTPLWLSISAEVFAEPQFTITAHDAEGLKAAIWDGYVTRMVTRARATCPYREIQVRHYLGWLAATLHTQELSELFLERMQPSWLDQPTRQLYRYVVGGVYALAYGLTYGLITWLAAGPASKLASGVINALMWMALSGTSGLPITNPVVGPDGGLKSGLVVGLIVGCFVGLIVIADESTLTITPAEVAVWTWRGAFGRRVFSALMSGLVGVLIGWIGYSSMIDLANGPAFNRVEGPEFDLLEGLALGMAVGLVFALTHWFEQGWELSIIDPHEHHQPNDGIRRSLNNGLRAALPLLSVAGVLIIGVLHSRYQWLFLCIWVVLLVAYQIAVLKGLNACLRHLALRITLRRVGYAPKGYTRFLQTMCNLQLLRQRGGGFSFYRRVDNDSGRG